MQGARQSVRPGAKAERRGEPPFGARRGSPWQPAESQAPEIAPA